MIKLIEYSPSDIKYSGRLTEALRKAVESEVGELDTATSFMYLFRRFGVPTADHSDEYKILYDYRFSHEDIIFSIHASYHKFVYFNLSIPETRLDPWIKKRIELLKELYLKYIDMPHMPYSMLPWGDGHHWLSKEENKANWEVISAAGDAFFTKEENDFIEEQQRSGEKVDSRFWKLMHPFENKLCTDFRARLSESELEFLNGYEPTADDVEGLKEQFAHIIKEVKRGFYVRDVAINIKGYESKENPITDFEDEEEVEL